MTEPTLLLIDDEPSDSLLPEGAVTNVLNPADDEFGLKLAAYMTHTDLVLLDHNLDLSGDLSLQASDGASLVGHLRSWARKNGMSLPPIAIYTSENEAFAGELPSVGPAVPLGGTFVGREAQISPTLDVEWIFAKDGNGVSGKIAALARASVDLRSVVGTDGASVPEIAKLLALPQDRAWSEIATDHLSRSRPPVTEANAGPEGVRGVTPMLRWLLQRALPYPGLLLSDLYAAWTLGISPDSLDELLSSDRATPWTLEVGSSGYAGPATELFSRRWWAAGIDFGAWALRSRADALGNMQAALDDLAGPGLQIMPEPEKVVVVDLDLNEEGLAALDEALQLHPPGWPAEAAEPWMS